VATSSSSTAATSATSTSIFTAAGQRLELQRLKSTHGAATAALAERRGLYDAAHARAIRRADNMSALPVVYVVAQTALLFHWVYQKFDWGLVEPITYLLNFSCVWLGVGIYMSGGANFTYDDLRTRYEEKRMAVERARDPRIPTVEELEAAQAECDTMARLLEASEKESF
jgi:hypothetical protein